MKAKINTKTTREFATLICNIGLKNRFQFKKVNVTMSMHSEYMAKATGKEDTSLFTKLFLKVPLLF